MKKTISIIILCSLLILSNGCNDSLDSIDMDHNFIYTYSTDRGLFAAYIKSDYSIGNNAKISSITETIYGIPCFIGSAQNQKIKIGVGNYNSEPVEFYEIKGGSGEVTYLGTLGTNICQLIEINGSIYVFRVEYNDEIASYYMDQYSLDDLNNRIKSMEIPGIPKEVIYDSDKNELFMLFIGYEDSSILYKINLATNENSTTIIDSNSFAQDIILVNDKLYVTLSGYVHNDTDISDNRVLTYDKDLNMVNEYIVDYEPQMIAYLNDQFYINYAGDNQYIALYDNNFNKKEEIPLDNAGYIMDAAIFNNNAIFISEHALYFIEEDVLHTVEVEGIININYE